jgi:hypothetical protein
MRTYKIILADKSYIIQAATPKDAVQKVLNTDERYKYFKCSIEPSKYYDYRTNCSAKLIDGMIEKNTLSYIVKTVGYKDYKLPKQCQGTRKAYIRFTIFAKDQQPQYLKVRYKDMSKNDLDAWFKLALIICDGLCYTNTDASTKYKEMLPMFCMKFNTTDISDKVLKPILLKRDEVRSPKMHLFCVNQVLQYMQDKGIIVNAEWLDTKPANPIDFIYTIDYRKESDQYPIIR